MKNQIFLWIAVVTGLILMIPLVAMQYTNDVDWSISDFVIMGVLMYGIGSMFVFTARRIHTTGNRIIIGIAFLLGLLYIWAELAVGIFTNLGS